MQSLAELPFVSGDVALDFVNTAEERGHPQCGDVLLGPTDLRLWGQRRGLIGDLTEIGPEAEIEFAAAHEARELLYQLFFALVHEKPLSHTGLQHLAELAAEAYAAARLSDEDGAGVTWQWNRSRLDTIRHTAVTSAVDLLAAGPTQRLKRCPGHHCGWFFLDTTKRGNRRWCLMEACGQEAKDERRRAQRRILDSTTGSAEARSGRRGSLSE